MAKKKLATKGRRGRPAGSKNKMTAENGNSNGNVSNVTETVSANGTRGRGRPAGSKNKTKDNVPDGSRLGRPSGTGTKRTQPSSQMSSNAPGNNSNNPTITIHPTGSGQQRRVIVDVAASDIVQVNYRPTA